MPYIKRRREIFNKSIEFLAEKIDDRGELNYCIYRLLLLLVKKWEKSYETYNSLIGVLTSIRSEFYRREVVPYEDLKKLENGDIES